MAIKILQIDLQNDITPQIGSYDNAGGVTPNNWLNEDGVYSLGPTNGQGTTPYYWFTPTQEVTDFDLCWEDYQYENQTTPQYHLEIGDSAGNVVLSAFQRYSSYSIGPVNILPPAYQTWHKILVEIRKASASSSTVTVYVDGKKIDTGTSDTLLTSAKIALLGHVPDSYYWQNAGQRLRYVTIYDRSYASKGINLDGMMTIIRELISKLITKLSTVAFTGSYNDLSNKPTISTVNNGTLTIQQNGTNVQTFTANSSTNKTANIQCVDLSTAQTIAGVKTFSDGFSVNKPSPRLQMKSTTYSNETSSAMTIGDIAFLGNDGRLSAWIVDQLRDDLTTRLCFRNFPKGGSAYKGFVFDENCNLYPENANSALGTSTNKWKLFNGINPGALSLPSNSYINIDTTNWDLTCQNGLMGSYTPTADGWLVLQVNNSGTSEVNFWLIGGGIRINNKSTLSTSSNNNFNLITIPVTKGTTYNIFGNASEYVAERKINYCRFMPCQGNV